MAYWCSVGYKAGESWPIAIGKDRDSVLVRVMDKVVLWQNMGYGVSATINEQRKSIRVYLTGDGGRRLK